jgi:hypothetical protein
MRRRLLLRNVPLASPVALSHDRYSPLWHGAFRQITPGALTLLWWVLLSLAGGRL